MKENGKKVSLLTKMKNFFLIVILFLSSSLYADAIYLDCNGYEICIYYPKNKGCRDYNDNFSLIFDEENEKAELSNTISITKLNILEVNKHAIVLGSPGYEKKDYKNTLVEEFEDFYYILRVNRISGKGHYVSFQDTITERRKYFSCILKEEKIF